MPASTTARLRKAEGSYRKAAERAEQLRQARNAALLEAIASGGMTKAEAARVTGLGRARIGQLVEAGAGAK